MNASWCTMLVLNILLTANRLFTIVFHFTTKSVFAYTTSTKAAILSKKELYLTIQVLTMRIAHIAGFLIWQFMPVPNDPWLLFLMHFVWMAWNSINPCLYLLINPTTGNKPHRVQRVQEVHFRLQLASK
uniref:G_PROTEIN_RECEP_F1_2 domain-containing protein n=1 Tax=Heterorhabditis bacteriophora TaxID=37862 RepID=A0A1I7WU37_HETBA